MRPYYYNNGYEGEPHFLDSCSLCHKKLSQNRDIYMYRGNKPYCSPECRQEQIAMDEAYEKRLKLSSSKRSTANGSARKTTAEDECDLTKKAVAVA